MTYIELLNNFWRSYRLDKLSDIDAVIYLCLLDACNAVRWLNPFELQTKQLEADLRITRKTIGEARNRLKQRGMIDFVEAKGRGPTTYLIEGADITNEALKGLFCVSPEKHNGEVCVSSEKHNGEVCVSSEKHNEPKNDICVSPRKHKVVKNDICVSPEKHNGEVCVSSEKHKTKSHLFSIEDISVANATPSKKPLAFPKEKKSRQPELVANTNPPPTFPTLDEVRRYFLSQSADTRLDDWELSARLFFDEYNSVGWKDKYGNKVTQWQGKANGWIFYRERAEKEKRQNNEQSQTYRPSGPSGGVPIRGRIVPGCGLKKRNPPGEN